MSEEPPEDIKKEEITEDAEKGTFFRMPNRSDEINKKENSENRQDQRGEIVSETSAKVGEKIGKSERMRRMSDVPACVLGQIPRSSSVAENAERERIEWVAGRKKVFQIPTDSGNERADGETG